MKTFEIIDDNGVIHSGDEIEMTQAFDVMTNSDEYSTEEILEWQNDWDGDLKLIEVHLIYR